MEENTKCRNLINEITEKFKNLINELFGLLLAIAVYMLLCHQWIPTIFYLIVVVLCYKATKKEIQKIEDMKNNTL